MSVVQPANAAATEVSAPVTSTLPSGGAVPPVSRRNFLVNTVVSVALRLLPLLRHPPSHLLATL